MEETNGDLLEADFWGGIASGLPVTREQFWGEPMKGLLVSYKLVPLSEWWNAEYQPLGTLRLAKKDIILTVADKDGGAHIDGKVPDTHATLSEPPFRVGVMMKNAEGLFSANRT